MIRVYLNDKVVFEGNEIDANKYCENHEWDYTQDSSYKEFERLCGLY